MAVEFKPLTVFVGAPTYDGRAEVESTLAGAVLASQKGHMVYYRSVGSSALCATFNTLWCAALDMFEEKKITHFAMLHDDIIPQRGWLDILADEMGDLDVLSVVSPIKDGRGLTSTAVADPENLWGCRRVTQTELYNELPETFTSEHVGGTLLVNTGCWLAKLGDWSFDHRFTAEDRIRKNEKGRLLPEFRPEDWEFSRWLHFRGLKYAATRKVTLEHCGKLRYQNNHPWGQWKQDIVSSPTIPSRLKILSPPPEKPTPAIAVVGPGANQGR